jgi:hypothetical protein
VLLCCVDFKNQKNAVDVVSYFESFVLVIIDEKTVNSCFDGQVIGFMADSVGLV